MIHTTEEFKLFLLSCPLRKFPKGRIVLYQGELPQYTYFIKRGVIKAYSITELGEEKIATFISNNELFPLVWPNDPNSVALYYYEALSDVEMYLISRDKLMPFLESNKKAMEYMLQYSIANYSTSLIRITALQQPKAQDKIAYILHHLMLRYGAPTESGKYEINLNLTQQDIAGYIGLTRETTALELNKLKRRSVISYRNKRYTVDKTKLLTLINEDSLSSVEA
ncbi:hypothetical protein CYG49_02615 [Candidatus Saccharibacteria bacterium]|nr:MAG: hypothetical protein CYG49_02615 [Candidatus Saccharibacteria bacterium]